MAHSTTKKEPKATKKHQLGREEVASNLIQFEEIRSKKNSHRTGQRWHQSTAEQSGRRCRSEALRGLSWRAGQRLPVTWGWVMGHTKRRTTKVKKVLPGGIMRGKFEPYSLDGFFVQKSSFQTLQRGLKPNGTKSCAKDKSPLKVKRFLALEVL